MINTYGQKLNLKETLVLNNDLILLANQILGEGKWSHTITNQTIGVSLVDFINYIFVCCIIISL